MLRACRGKLEAVSFRRGSHQTVWRGRTDLSLTFRMFGTDAEVNATLVKALAPLNLYQFNERAEDQTHGSSTCNWSLELNRLVAPKGAARQTQVVLTWSRFPSPVQERGKCRKPKSMEADSTLPKWLRTHSKERSTRRRVVAEISGTLNETSGEVVMLYHNGYAHDEGVGHFSSGLKRAGYVLNEGSGPQQRWSHPNGSQVFFESLSEVHDMGCTLAGPLLSIQWRDPTPQE